MSRSALGQWREAIAAYRRAESLGAPPTLVLYNLASVFARASQPDSAVAVLQRLVGQGYFQVERIEQEPHFASIRVLPGYAEVVARARRNDNPCADKPESRQFDFWVGDWDVFDNRAKQPVGSSRIERILGDCVIFENWTGLSGMSGKSINAWNADRRCWQQTWMDDKGGVIHFTDGRWDGERLMFMADVTDSSGKSMKNRLSFFPLGPDEVRQFSEQSRDGGTTWTVEYDFGYRRKKI